MAAIFWAAATLVGLVLGLVSAVALVAQYAGRAIAVAAMVAGAGVGRMLPRTQA